MLDEVTLKEYADNSNGMFAIMIENEEGEYEEYTDSTSWPTGMVFNASMSGCIDNDGNTLDNVLSFNASSHIASVSTSETSYCYLYFDSYGELAKAILLAENDSESVSDAISYIEAKGEPDFSTTATTDEGLYAAEDDYGISYYFRGAVEDNYVYFAGFYWRIIRINGDGSVRLIYDGTEAHANGDSSTDRYVSAVNYYSLSYSGIEIGRNAYVGYMHGDATYTENHTTTTFSFTTAPSSSVYFGDSYTFDSTTGLYYLKNSSASMNGYTSFSGLNGYFTCYSSNVPYCKTLYYIYNVTSSSSADAYIYGSTSDLNTYDEEHANAVNSTAKSTIDAWYEYYLVSYSDYLSDTLFCNDRSFASTNTGDGVDTSTTYYAFSERDSNYSPILTCIQKNDRFTVDDETLGNGDLTYPVGLITADEVVMAGEVLGSNDYANSTFYLYNGYKFYTMTPYSYTGYANITVGGGYVYYGSYWNYHVSTTYVRPVINLSSSVVVTSGDGTYDSPYEVALS